MGNIAENPLLCTKPANMKNSESMRSTACLRKGIQRPKTSIDVRAQVTMACFTTCSSHESPSAIELQPYAKIAARRMTRVSSKKVMIVRRHWRYIPATRLDATPAVIMKSAKMEHVRSGAEHSHITREDPILKTQPMLSTVFTANVIASLRVRLIRLNSRSRKGSLNVSMRPQRASIVKSSGDATGATPDVMADAARERPRWRQQSRGVCPCSSLHVRATSRASSRRDEARSANTTGSAFDTIARCRQVNCPYMVASKGWEEKSDLIVRI
mmetsp:Transcript_57593/g.182417  ORF Transcript_57593/g.182417 Transcript_57593/m.182417 type:complete len:270 (+) Transcript_57593:285-1094(+)